MRICHITSMHEWNDDRIFERACKALAREGHDVTLIATRDRGEMVEGVRILPLRERRGLARRLFSSRDAYRIALSLDCDVYHFHDPDLLPWMRRLKKQGRVVVYDIHEIYQARFAMWGLNGRIEKLLRRLFADYEAKAIQAFDGIVVVTETMRSMFSPFARRSLAIHNVQDLSTFRDLDLEQPKSPVWMVYTSGTNSPDRNCMVLIKALPTILERFPDLVVKFVGRYQPQGYEQELLAEARALGVEGSLVLEGMRPWKENFERTVAAHIGCVFYSDNENNRVAMPNRVFEYMLCRVAILAHDYPELRRLIEEHRCGELVDSSSPLSVAQGVIRMLESPERLEQMAQAGREAVLERYNFMYECRELEKFYTELTGR